MDLFYYSNIIELWCGGACGALVWCGVCVVCSQGDRSPYLLVDFSESAKNGLFKFPIYSLGKLVNLGHFRVMALTSTNMENR